MIIIGLAMIISLICSSLICIGWCLRMWYDSLIEKKVNTRRIKRHIIKHVKNNEYEIIS